MGMFDYIRCKYPLPIEVPPNQDFQTKSLSNFLELYEIREDGTLWHENYEIEDRSDPNAEGVLRYVGCATRVNKTWVPWPHTGEIVFYTGGQDWWVEFSAYFITGILRTPIECVHRCNT
jgi:hypothetical protein